LRSSVGFRSNRKTTNWGVHRSWVRSVLVIRSNKISDHWKEKVVLVYAKKIAVNSVMLGVYFAVIAGAIYIAILLADVIAVKDLSVEEFFLSSQGLLLVSITSMFYFYARVRFVRNQL
ncbi:MAG: hypothetical protein CO089_02395, partial [Zetaproteobacteria bacterium CG_4_9_14_0_8_um_filter_55_31]